MSHNYDVMEGVLVAAVTKKFSSSSSSEDQKTPPPPPSASGFILEDRGASKSSCNGRLVVTSASWLTDVLHLEIANSNSLNAVVRWSYKDCKPDDVQFLTLLDGGSDGGNEHGHVIRRVELVGVYLLPSVYSVLSQQLSSLSNWRVAIGGEKEREEEREAAVSRDESISSLLLHLICVVVLKIEGDYEYRRSTSPPPYSNLTLQVGDTVHITGTPFGSFCPEVFFNSRLSGSISKLLSPDGTIFLTDAQVLPGCEGALVFDRHHCTCGMIMTGLSTVRGSLAGLALACSIHSVIEALRGHLDISGAESLLSGTRITNEHSRKLSSEPSFLAHLSDAVVMVTSKDMWGSGIRVTPSLVLTCQHVVQNTGGQTDTNVRVSESPGEVVYSSTLPDIALIKLTAVGHSLDCSLHKRSMKSLIDFLPINSTNSFITTTPYNAHHHYSTLTNKAIQNHHSSTLTKGTEVYAIGYGFENPIREFNNDSDYLSLHCGCEPSPLMTKGSVLNVIGYDGEVVMFVTSAVVHPGMSGGLVVRGDSGEPIGMVVSNSRDKESDALYPSVNYCLPLSLILPHLSGHIATGDTLQLCHGGLGRWVKRNFKMMADLWNLRTRVDIGGTISEVTGRIQSKL